MVRDGRMTEGNYNNVDLKGVCEDTEAKQHHKLFIYITERDVTLAVGGNVGGRVFKNVLMCDIIFIYLLQISP